MYAKIFVPIDGSETSKQGLREAIKVAKDQHSHLRLLHIVANHALDIEYCIGTYVGDVVKRLRHAGKTLVHDAQTVVRGAGIKSDAVTIEFEDRSAAAAILEHAREWPAALVVMGTHGRRGLLRLALGSDAEGVVRDADVPVLLVRSS